MLGLFAKHYRKILPVVDFFAIVGSTFVAMLFAKNFIDSGLTLYIMNVAIYMSMFLIFKFYNIMWAYADATEFIMLSLVCIMGGILSFLVNRSMFPMSIRTGTLSAIFITAIVVIIRLQTKMFYFLGTVKKEIVNSKEKKIKVLIVGAGNAGELCLHEMRRKGIYDIIGFVDDAKEKQHATMCGVKVLGTRHDIELICKDNEVDEILLAIPSIEETQKVKIAKICEKTGCKVKIIPHIYKVITSQNLLSAARNIQIEDLLCRDKIMLDCTKIKEYINNQVVLITGGGGSIGSEICRQVGAFKPKKLVVLDNYENNAYEILLELNSTYPEMDTEVIIATVRDKNAIESAFDKIKPDVVFHAAAHKHVPLMEDVPKEAIKNNVFGTFTVAQAAIKYNAKRFVMISTDKAVNPTNVMGASKRLCEMIIQAFNGNGCTEFVAVRFGNVLGSNGSVIPIFTKQIKNGGPVTITHKEITRFFMTIPEAAQLVLQAGVYANKGEIFVLDMGKPVKIYELAEKMITLMGYVPGKDINIVISGLRPGEKLYEELLMAEEGLTQTEHNKIYIAKPMQIDKQHLYEKLIELENTIDDMTDEEVKDYLSYLVPTYVKQNDKKNVAV